MPVEHLWEANHEGGNYHGFRFRELNQEQELIISEFIGALDRSVRNGYKETVLQ